MAAEETAGGAFGGLVIIALIALLWITNPKQSAFTREMAQDGWVPVARERSNWGVLSYEHVTGFTGATCTYIGVGGQVIKIGGD
jgi:hypothetical protein